MVRVVRRKVLVSNQLVLISLSLRTASFAPTLTIEEAVELMARNVISALNLITLQDVAQMISLSKMLIVIPVVLMIMMKNSSLELSILPLTHSLILLILKNLAIQLLRKTNLSFVLLVPSLKIQNGLLTWIQMAVMSHIN